MGGGVAVVGVGVAGSDGGGDGMEMGQWGRRGMGRRYTRLRGWGVLAGDE